MCSPSQRGMSLSCPRRSLRLSSQDSLPKTLLPKCCLPKGKDVPGVSKVPCLKHLKTSSTGPFETPGSFAFHKNHVFIPFSFATFADPFSLKRAFLSTRRTEKIESVTGRETLRRCRKREVVIFVTPYILFFKEGGQSCEAMSLAVFPLVGACCCFLVGDFSHDFAIINRFSMVLLELMLID